MVATVRRELGIRLSVQDADVVRRALEGTGSGGQQALRRIERASKPASRGLKAVNTAAREGQAALHGYAAQAGPLGAVLSSIGPAGLLVGAGLGIAGGAAVTLVGDFAELAERAKVMRESFERMAQSRGSNPAQLMEEITEATRGTLDQIKALTVANTALSSGIEPLYKNLGQIIKDTRSVSTALGRNASVDIERVISAINKQEQELLDELGIVARAETAYKTYANQLGTTASKLTDLQKRTAFANLVIGQLREKAEAVGDPINRSAEASQRFNSAWMDLKITLGSFVDSGGMLDLLATGVRGVDTAVKELSKVEIPESILTLLKNNALSNLSGISGVLAVRDLIVGEEERDFPTVPREFPTVPLPPGPEPPPTLADIAAIFDGLMSDVPEVSDDPLRDELGDHTARNFEAETILAKKRRDLRLGEITDTDELARANLRWRQIQLETQLKATGTTKEQFTLLEQLNAEEMQQLGEKQDAVKELADAESDLAEKRARVARVSSETTGILTRLAPDMRGFFGAAASLGIVTN